MFVASGKKGSVHWMEERRFPAAVEGKISFGTGDGQRRVRSWSRDVVA
jgi:hypothetical protein